MPNEMFDRFASLEFAAKLGFNNKPTKMIDAIRETEEYMVLKEAIESGEIQREHIIDWIDEQQIGRTPGFRDHSDIPLAVIACALHESDLKEFRYEYLKDLSSLKVLEIRSAIDVARELFGRADVDVSEVYSWCM